MMVSNANPVRILIVDDEPEIRDVLVELLEADYECTPAGSAEDALGLLSAQPFELIISDISMSGISGLEMIPHIFRRAPQAVVIMISGLQSIESAIGALRVGVFDYITKPFDLRQVEVAVSRAWEHYELCAAGRFYKTQLETLVAERTAALDGAMNSLEAAYRSTLKALTSALETRDLETHGHSERVVTYSLRLGRELGLAKEQMRSLEYGSLLHDIGKVGVPDAILRKPAKLTDKEWVEMKQHPRYGQQILGGIDFLQGAARVVAQHHERWDGTGYPTGLRGEAIDRNARIFAVADAFDAMMSNRVYRQGMTYEAAAAELDQWAGVQFDPQVIAAFHRVPTADWSELQRQSLNGKLECLAAQQTAQGELPSRSKAAAGV